MKARRFVWVLLLLLFCTVFSAMAETDGAKVDRLLGLWKTKSPDAKAQGVYFRMDGVCLLYDTLLSDREVGSPSRYAAWHMEEGTLYVTQEDGSRFQGKLIPEEILDGRVVRYALSLTGEKTVWYEEAWMQPALEDIVPQEVRQDAKMQYPDLALEDYTELPDTPDGMHAFLLMKGEGERRMLGYRYQAGVWDKMLDVKEGVPQGDLPAFIGHVQRGSVYENIFGSRYHDGDRIAEHGGYVSVTTSNGESYVDRVRYMYHQGGYQLIDYTKDITNAVYLIDGDMVLINYSAGFQGEWKCRVETDVEQVDFLHLPATEWDVEDVLRGMPLLPYVDKHSLLHREVKFPAGRKYPVYMGPGTTYERAAGGKAAVSTNGWIQVLGEYNDMWLIQYELDKGRYRIGWIEKDQDAEVVRRMQQLAFDTGYEVYQREGALLLTDDPLGTQKPFAETEGKATVHVLAKLDAHWLYVRIETEEDIFWGFVPAQDL